MGFPIPSTVSSKRGMILWISYEDELNKTTPLQEADPVDLRLG